MSYDSIYISPHEDDAVLSCGGKIASEHKNKKILIITIFGRPSEITSKKFARRKKAFDEYETRNIEDSGAMEFLNVDYVRLEYPELFFRGSLLTLIFPTIDVKKNDLYSDLYIKLKSLITEHLSSNGYVFFPLAIGAHRDHFITFQVGKALTNENRENLFFYEDIPYVFVPYYFMYRMNNLCMNDERQNIVKQIVSINSYFSEVHGYSKVLSLIPLFFVVLIHVVCIKRKSNIKINEMEPYVFEVKETDFFKKISAIQQYKSQLKLLFGNDSVSSIEKRLREYSQKINSAIFYQERCWKIY